MKKLRRNILISITLTGLILPLSAKSQVDCINWNTGSFFATAFTTDVHRCLDLGASPHARDENGQTPMHHAVVSATGRIVEILISAGADVDGGWGRSPAPLAAAAWGNDLDMMRLLLEKGASPNPYIFGGHTLLPDYADKRDSEILRLLLDAGADPCMLNGYGITALHKASYETIDILLDACGDLNARRAEGRTSLHNMTECYGESDQTHEVVRRMLDRGADPNAVADNGSTPLHQSMQNCSPELTEILLDGGTSQPFHQYPNTNLFGGDLT